MVRCPLAVLRRDADQDGLTDIGEQRLVTSADDRDTDGDGLDDAHDPTPLGAAPADTPAREVWVEAVKQIVAPRAHGQLLITEVDGPRLAVRDVDLRLLELRHDELEAYKARFGFRVTFGIEVTMHGDDQADVGVSFGWQGGSWHAERDASGHFRFTSSGMWITRADAPQPTRAG